MTTDVLCFGELLLRLSPPGNERFGQSGTLNVQFGGAEANVGVSLARFGHSVDMMSAIPEDNALADSVLADLRAQGVRPLPRVVLSSASVSLQYQPWHRSRHLVCWLQRPHDQRQP